MAAGAGWMGKVIDILVLQALVRQVEGENNAALQALEKALVLAEPEGYVRTFIDAGPRMAKLLRLAVEKGISPQYAGKLLALFAAETPDKQSMAEAIPMPSSIKPLTDRECEVLRMLATDLSGPEIARELTIALTTLRFHSRNIYSKLNVNSRRSAVRKAKELKFV